jgi:hypothetical protein
MGIMSVKITPNDWAQFKKHYMFEFIRNSDYRFGQAFLNYFPALSKHLIADGYRGESIEQRLWNAPTQDEAMSIIGKMILEGDIER